MKSGNLLVLSLIIIGALILFKKGTTVAEKLPPVRKRPNIQNPKVTNKPIKERPRKRKKITKFSQTPQVKVGEAASLYKKGKESQKLVREFRRKTYLDIPNFSEFEFADFSEDEVAIMVGKNDFGDKLTFVATRAVIPGNDLVKTLAEDPTFLKASDPDFRADLMRPVMTMDKRNGFGIAQIWKSSQNGKDYYMLYAPREDGKGSYGILLDGKRDKLDANEDYYEEKFLKIKARNTD